jgi:hypothetical protein
MTFHVLCTIRQADCEDVDLLVPEDCAEIGHPVHLPDGLGHVVAIKERREPSLLAIACCTWHGTCG